MSIKKYTWKKLRREFKSSYPNLSKESNYWCPHDFMQIEIYLNDGRRIIFDGVTKSVEFIEPWKEVDD